MKRKLLAIALFVAAVQNSHARTSDLDDSLGDFMDGTPEYGLETLFVSPARMSSSFIDSPNSVSKLDAQMLRYLGITNVKDAMRLVPGMQVVEDGETAPTIGYHGVNLDVPRRTELLFDSTELFRPGYAAPAWARLPVEMRDLSAVEVVRGSSMEYGSNAITSTINLIGEEPALRGQNLSLTGGNRDTHGGSILLAKTSGDTKLEFRYNEHYTPGYEYEAERDDDNELDRQSALVSLSHAISDTKTLDVKGAFSQSKYIYHPPGPIDNSVEAQAALFFDRIFISDEDQSFVSVGFKSTDLKDHTIQLNANAVKFKADQPFRGCFPQIFFDPFLREVEALDSVEFAFEDQAAFVVAAFTGILPLQHSIVGEVTESDQALINEFGLYIQSFGLQLADEICGTKPNHTNERRNQLALEVTSTLSDKWTNVFTAQATQNDVENYGLLEGTVKQVLYSLYNSTRYQYSPDLTLNLTTVVEDANNDKNSAVFSYRASANYMLSSSSVLRALSSRSRRLPDIFETDRKWSQYYIYDEGTTDHLGRTEAVQFQYRESPDNLKPEILDTIEVGLTKEWRGSGLLFDAKLFREDYNNLISEPFRFLTFGPTNNTELSIDGIEFELRLTRDDYRAGIAFSAQDNEANLITELANRGKTTASVWVIYHLNPSLTVSAAYYGQQYETLKSYDRFDLTLTKDFSISSRMSGSVQFNFRRYPEYLEAFPDTSVASPVISSLGDRNRFLITFELDYR